MGGFWEVGSIHHINNKLKRHFEDIKYLMKKQEKLVEEMNKSLTEKENYVINLETTVRKLIEHGLSKDEILDITGINLERYEEIVAERKYYNIPNIYLTDDEVEVYEQLLREIQNCININELINPFKKQKRIKFIHKVILRYKQEYDFLKSKNSDNYEELILNYIDRSGKNQYAKRAYSTLIRRYSNEIERMRGKVLIQFTE